MRLIIEQGKDQSFDQLLALRQMHIRDELSVTFETATGIIDMNVVAMNTNRHEIELVLKEKPKSVKAGPSKNPAAVYMEADQNP